MNEELEQLKSQIDNLKNTINEIKEKFVDIDVIVENHKHQGYDRTPVIDLGFGSTDTLTPVSLSYGYGSPEGIISANAGSLYTNLDGGASLTLYVKESGSSDTGWIAK